MRTVFSTHVSDDWYEPIGAKKLLTSAKHFHPEIPFIVFKTKDIQQKFTSDPSIDWDTLIAPFCLDLAKEYDLVVHFDADSCITDYLDEILTADYDVAGVRNNNDFGKAGSLPYSLEPPGTDPFQYLNAGLVAATKVSFWQDWVNLNKEKGHTCPMRENDTLNEVFHNGKYKTKILDPKESNLYYGTATQFGHRFNWESWKCIKKEQSGLYLNNKKVKVLHHAGGHELPKLKLNMFSPKVQLYLRFIADPPTFIDSKGKPIILQDENFIKMLYNAEYNHFAKILSDLTEDNLLFKKLIGKTNLTILSFGNMGLYSLFLSSRAKKIYAIEPTKEYTKVMKDLFAKNKVTNVEFVDNSDLAADLAVIDTYDLTSIDKIITNKKIKSFLVLTQDLSIASKFHNPEVSGSLIYSSSVIT